MLMAIGLCGASLSARADEVADVLTLHRSGQTAAALKQADRFLANQPKDVRMRFAKGVMLADSRKDAEAIALFTSLTQDHPELPEPYNNLAALQATAGNYEAARFALEQALRANPSYATAHENLGDVYLALAGASYARALKLDPGNAALQPKLTKVNELLKAPPANTAASAP